MDILNVQNAALPVLGLGTWQMHGDTCRQSVRTAIELGYRHIDTAQMYRNETEVGNGLRDSGVTREEIFLTTKVIQANLAPEKVLSSTRESLQKLDSEYIDLLLIHWPSATVPIPETIAAMNDLQDEGVVKHIGVSNFSVPEMKKAIKASSTPILTNQVEYYPGRNQDTLLKYCQENERVLAAYSPLGQGRIIGHPVLQDVGKKYDKTSAQVALRWLIQQQNVAVIPKASTAKHIQENMEVFDFELSDEEMETVASL